ncbi:hypothetical protein L9F63_018272, partial [Diploptera punctata]
ALRHVMGPQPLLPGSASSTRIPSPVENKKPPAKSRIPRSQPVSRDPSPARKKSLNQPRQRTALGEKDGSQDVTRKNNSGVTPAESAAISRQPGAPSSSVEAIPTPPQSRGKALLLRLCPCCLGSKTAAAMETKTEVPSQPAGKCAWLKRCLCCGCCRKKTDSDAGRRKSIAPSQFSKKQSRSSSTAVEPDTRPKLDPSLLEQGSMMRGAIPVLPVPLAWICLIFNIIVPGLGTITSGLFCLCFGKPRFQPRDDPQGRCGAFVVNLIVGASQLFTVIFCLVGWGWSIWWGFIMLRVAKKYKKLKKAEAAQQQNNPAPATQQNHDVERGHPA